MGDPKVLEEVLKKLEDMMFGKFDSMLTELGNLKIQQAANNVPSSG